ncbi:MAG: alpha/beta hydrolase-fold protein [Candidatus Ornithospirochaeta sp.]
MKGISEFQKYGEGKRYVYMIGGEDYVESFSHSFPDTVFISIKVEDWNSYLSPYKADNPFRKGEMFEGYGELLLSSIRDELIPSVEDKEDNIERYLIGYSMGGLFALYASSVSDLWDGMGSVSGSLWFDNFDTYVDSNPPKSKKIYISLGKKEKESRNRVLKCVEDKTKAIYDILKREGIDCTFVLNEGGHFQEEDKRLRDAISYLLG